MWKRAAFFLLTPMGLLACDTPCTALEEHALGCGAATPRYVDEPDSACFSIRREFGTETFDEFAACVTGTTCDNANAIDGCVEQNFDALTSQDPCSRFRLWTAACGLELIIDPGADCLGLDSLVGGIPLEGYIDCITAGGCPEPNDSRWVECQTPAPGPVNELLEACETVNQWTVQCEGQSLSIVPVLIITVPQCLAAAQPFTVESHTTYANCLSGLECSDIPRRIDCITDLTFIDDDTAKNLCPVLVAFGEACGVSLGGGGEQACITAFQQFTPDSFSAYVGCVLARPCGDPAAALECGQQLELQ